MNKDKWYLYLWYPWSSLCVHVYVSWSDQLALCVSQGNSETHCLCHWFAVNWMITTLACNTTVSRCCQSVWASHCHLNCCLWLGFSPYTIVVITLTAVMLLFSIGIKQVIKSMCSLCTAYTSRTGLENIHLTNCFTDIVAASIFSLCSNLWLLHLQNWPNFHTDQ